MSDEGNSAFTFPRDVENANNTLSPTHLSSMPRKSPNSLRQRGYVSRHRQILNFIRTDAAEARSYTVPHRSSSFDHTRESSRMNRLLTCLASNGGLATISQMLDSSLPIKSWIRSYEVRSTFPKDLIAGLTVGIMVIPQSMSYAKLAGLPVEYGLYSALVPVYTYRQVLTAIYFFKGSRASNVYT